MPYSVGSVPYVNAIPLLSGLRASSEVAVVTDVPSRLPALLDAGDVDAILVSSIYALTQPGIRAVAGVGIASDHAVESVRLFARCDWSEVKTLATDQSSMTSNALAQIVLAETYGVHPTTSPQAPDLTAMLEEFDACVLIGDIGMLTEAPPSIRVLDLGLTWRDLTGLPFVWALWAGRDGLTSELASLLHEAPLGAGFGTVKDRQLVDELIERSREIAGWPEGRLETYFHETMTYELTDDHLEALRLFGEKARAFGFETSWPQFVGEPAVTA